MTALIFDTETHKLHGDIIEAAAMEVQFQPFTDYPIIPTMFDFTKRYKPSEPISIAAMAIHHIVDEDLVKCPSYTKFKLPKDNIDYLIGHNIDYDIDAIERAGTDASGIKRICTLAMARYLWPHFESHKLTALAYQLSCDRKATRRGVRGAHSALNDCKTTHSLLLNIVRARQIKSMEELYQFSQIARIPTHIFYGPHRGKAIADLSSYDLEYIARKSDDQYLLTAIQTELLSREEEELPFI
ncbi:MAG: 3'-5' exonuclease [Acinetobacter sp.]|uniref:3'-5' exonuclease n=1 Tax=Acinetobacter TaxID=469 RepID=UPI00097F7374|nr:MULTISPECIES: 3'-5' exonuclease [Acinetobacter]ONN53226.1 DNA exonuclease [Acinetobacter genomosp. 33YU]PZT84666.1 MAG: 3'-5' exonuclease [Acinetobacter sp.]